jgi:prepilin-type N-terminal cleavage/methylation domain-containing protein
MSKNGMSVKPFLSLEHGFSLIEMAIVLFIIGLLLGGLLPTISSQIEQKRTAETLKQLDEIQQALIGFAILNTRLPCPASAASNGVEKFALGNDENTGVCLNPYDGFVPAATLGITTGLDQQGNKGFAVDAWNNRIRYAVTTSNTNAFTKKSGMSASFSTLAPDLQVCSTATNITNKGTATASCDLGPPTTSLTSGVPVVVYSMGKNGSYGGTGTDEKENPNVTTSPPYDRLFISHIATPAPNEFDDLVIWISPNILINRLVTAGKLP